jgi:hypothetical protein
VPWSGAFSTFSSTLTSQLITPTGRKTFVVTCKRCRRDVPSGREEFPFQSVTVECPLCGELRQYRPSEVFLGKTRPTRHPPAADWKPLMFDPDAGMPRINRGMVYLGACLIAGIRLARERQVNPPMTHRERQVADIEGWILGRLKAPCIFSPYIRLYYSCVEPAPAPALRLRRPMARDAARTSRPRSEPCQTHGLSPTVPCVERGGASCRPTSSGGSCHRSLLVTSIAWWCANG